MGPARSWWPRSAAGRGPERNLIVATQQTVDTALSSDVRTLRMDSFHLGERVDLEACSRAFVDRLLHVSKSDLSMRLGEGRVFLFSFGSVVFVDVERSRIDVFLRELVPYVEDPSNERVMDDFLIEIRPGGRESVSFDRAILAEESSRKIQIAAMVMAQSTTLEHFEKMAEQLLQRASTVTDGMASGGQVLMSQKEMIRFIGLGLSARREIVSRLSILDSPELAWEDHALDKLFHDIKGNFELSTRFRSLEYKLRLIHESVEVIVDLSNTRRSTMLELTIIFLIAFEILMALFGGPH